MELGIKECFESDIGPSKEETKRKLTQLELTRNCILREKEVEWRIKSRSTWLALAMRTQHISLNLLMK